MKDPIPKIALIPAYQPEVSMLQLIEALALQHFFIVVVDDGSGTTFQPLFQNAEANAVVLHHAQNQGKGAALKTGMQYIQSNRQPPYTVVTLDADGQHTVIDAEKVCTAAAKLPNALILGSRSLRDNVPLRSRLGNGITRFVFHISTGIKVHDTQTGLRAFSDQLMQPLLQIPGARYEYEMNVLMQLARQKTPLYEVPISTIYLNDNASSHFDTVRDSFRIYKEILKFSMASLTSFVIDYTLFCLLAALTGSVLISNVSARIISGTINYTLNRRLVFQSKNKITKSAVQYAILATGILICNTCMLELLTRKIGLPSYVAKLLTELLLFLLSWTIQRTWIFKKRS